jgi:hypothetical protein
MKLFPVFTSTISIVLLISATACKKTVHGNGPLISKNITIEDFNSVSLMISANVKVVMADSFKCIIRAQQNIADAIKIENDGSDLEITSEFNLKSDEPIEVFVSLPVIERVQVNGSGDISFVNPAKGDKLRLYVNGSGSISARVEMETIKAELNGSGDISLSGSAEETSYDINGSGDLHAFDLSSDEVGLSINGSGDAEVNAGSKLKADLKGSGSVRYKGQPHVVSDIIGSGTINKAD